MEQFDPIQLYFKEIKAIPPIPPDRLQLVWKRALKGDKKSQKLIVEANLRLVIPIAKRFCRTGIEFLDLIEEGNMGLMRAVEKFNPQKKVQFSTYATYWIEQSVRHAVEEKSKTIRIPPHMWDSIHHWLKNWKPLQKKLGRDPTMQEMGKLLHMTTPQIKNIMAATQLTHGVSSLDTPLDAEGSLFIKDIISDHESSPESVTELIRQNSDISRALNFLEQREKNIIEWRFGLNNLPPKSLEEIGDKLNLSRERIRQLEERALKRLKILAVKVKLVELKDSKDFLLDSRSTKRDRRVIFDRRANRVDRRIGLPDTRAVKVNRRSGIDRRVIADQRHYERRH
ncbi:MAG: sigma-70 family RNA polymerase sigma factor [Elusimicrobiota bacterium]